MKLEYFTKLPIVDLVFNESKVEGIRPSGNAYLRASDIVAIEERTPIFCEGIAYTSVLTNAVSHGDTYMTSLTAAEVVAEIARANNAVKEDAEKEMADMMSKMQGTMSFNTGSDITYGDSN